MSETIEPVDAAPDGGRELHVRVLAVRAAARFHGIDLDPELLRKEGGGAPPSSAGLVEWTRDAGLWARAIRVNFRQLLKIETTAPVILLLKDGGAAIMVAADRERAVVFLRDPRAPQGTAPVPVDELQLGQLWDGTVLLVRGERGEDDAEPVFNFALLFRMVWREKRILRDIAISSVTLTVLQVIPALLVMVVLNSVIEYHAMNTLALISIVFVIAILWEAVLTWGRQMMLVMLSTRLDARLNLMIFDRLMTIPIEFFERNQAGQIGYKVGQIYRVRDFITGRLLTTFINIFMIALVLPILFYLNAFLAWTVLIASATIAVIITAFLPALARLTGRIIEAESRKGAVLVESLYGVRTVKALALERYATIGVLLLGGYVALTSQNPLAAGSLVGFMLLGGRVAGPLISFARLVQDAQEARAAVGIVGEVLNRPTERRAMNTGLRPAFRGAVAFEEVTFTYEGGKTPALNKVSFSIPEGTMLGIVGRSGSGKSTITRLLQGINRDYLGAVKIDNTELREINLRHLRKSFGVVLQDNFLFRGSVRDNIIAGRPGLTFEDAIRAARLAGAEEFIERLPQGYETFVEEGSPNLSGGQKQRLAIARALIADPRLLILDEATSALDPESEALINANLLRIARGRTMVIVSHRLASLVDCDMILVMDAGRVVDIGRHADLVERCAIYRHLWLQQNRHMNPEGGRHAPTPTLAQGD
jgi:ABC-type bacteriocin/lantibiotic exporter with double-glycine peptidase domain